MRRPLACLLAAVTLAGVAACGSGGGEKVKEPPPAAPASMRLLSPAVRDGDALPRAFTCDGAGGPPPLRWSGVPARARSLALLVEDPDAAGGSFVHWALWGLRPRDGGLLPGALPAGARQGRNGFGKQGWGAPCPPKGDAEHRYVFRLYALSAPLDLPAGAKGAAVQAAIGRAAVAQGRLVASFRR